MRVFVMMLIFAIGFAGYSAAAHASAQDSCNPAMAKDIKSFDCADHQAGHDQKKDASPDNDASGKGKCPDCNHCCAFHAAGLFSHDAMSIIPPGAAIPGWKPVTGLAGDYLSSLLRPPKSLA